MWTSVPDRPDMIYMAREGHEQAGVFPATLDHRSDTILLAQLPVRGGGASVIIGIAATYMYRVYLTAPSPVGRG